MLIKLEPSRSIPRCVRWSAFGGVRGREHKLTWGSSAGRHPCWMDWARTRSPAASRRPRRSACLLCCCCYYYYYYCYSYLHSPPCFLGCGHREGCYDYPGVSEQEEQSATSGQRDATCKHEQNANFLPPFGEIAISAPFSTKGRADSGKGKMNRKVPDKDQRKRKKNAKRNGDQKERTGRKLAASLYGRNLSFSTCTAHTLFFCFSFFCLLPKSIGREREDFPGEQTPLGKGLITIKVSRRLKRTSSASGQLLAWEI